MSLFFEGIQVIDSVMRISQFVTIGSRIDWTIISTETMASTHKKKKGIALIEACFEVRYAHKVIEKISQPLRSLIDHSVENMEQGLLGGLYLTVSIHDQFHIIK